MRLCCRIPTRRHWASLVSKWHFGGTGNDRIHSSNADLTSILIDGGLHDSLLVVAVALTRSLVEMALTVWRVRMGTIFWRVVLVRICFLAVMAMTR